MINFLTISSYHKMLRIKGTHQTRKIMNTKNDDRSPCIHPALNGHRLDHLSIFKNINTTMNHTRKDLNKKNENGFTLVHVAAKNHQLHQLATFKKLKANFKLRTDANETPLLLVIKHMPTSKLYTLEELTLIDLVTYKNCDVNVPDNKGYSPLHYAARLCSGRVVEKLIRLGANVNCQKNDLRLAPLHCAMQCSRLDIVDALIRHNAKVNPTTIDGLTPLHLAVASSSIQIAKYLIDLGAKINYRENSYFFTPMHVALIKRCQDMFDILVNNGADVNLASRDGVTCLHLATMVGDVEVVEILIKFGADVNCRDKSDLITPVHIALSKGKALKIVFNENSLLTKFLKSDIETTNPNYNAVFFSLLKNGADVKSITRSGKNAFHFALESASTDTDIIEVLLESEIDINAVTKDGKSSMHFAIEFCDDCLKIFKLLMKHRADVHLADRNGVTPLHVAAGCEGRKDVIKELINAGVNVNALTKDGRSTMHLAAESGDVDNVKILMEHGVDMKCKEKVFQYTALHLAVTKTRVKVIEELVHGGVDVDAKDESGKTALHLATCYQDEMVKVLVKCGAYVDVQDHKCRTPLHYAVEHNNRDALMVLVQSGASINDVLLCRDFNVERIFEKRGIREFMMRHLMELKALGFPIANAFERYITQDDLQSVYYKNCVNEVVMLKSHLLSIKVSLYDFLHMDPDSRFIHTKGIPLSEVESKFLIYKSYIQNSCREAVDRKPLLEPAKLALNWFLKIDIPDSCMKRMFLYLKSWHLKAIAVAVQKYEKNFGELVKTQVCRIQ